MRLFRITRSFSQGFPSELITNIPTIDAYLHTIEQELPGRQALRCQLLEEVRDHLLEHHAQLIEGGMDSVTAAEQVTEAFGDPVVFGRSRRHEVLRKFVKIFVIATVSFLTLTLLMAWANPPAANFEGITLSFWQRHLVPILNAPVFALVMSYSMVFVWVKPKPDLQGGLRVYSEHKKRLAALYGVLYMGAVSVIGVLGLLSIGMLRSFSPLISAAFVIFGLLTAYRTLITWNVYSLEDDVLYVKSLFKTTQIPLKQIESIQSRRGWLHRIELGNSRSLDIQWRNADGRSKRLKLPLHDNMNNADLFQARLYTSLEHPQ